VVFVNLVHNISPLLLAVLSYWLYKVALTRLEIVVLAVSFIGVSLIISGSLNENTKSTNNSDISNWQMVLPILCMIVIPINGACIGLTLREMREMNEMTLAAYIVLAMFVVYFPVIILGKGFAYLSMFDWVDWLIWVLLGVLSFSLQLARAVSIKYEEPAKVAVLNYFQPIV